jgi:hypothetical protein
MAELTDEQVRLATKAANDVAISFGFPEMAGKVTAEEQENIMLMTMRAAAPLLQIPWDEPSMDETNAIEREIPRHAPPCDQLMRALSLFVHRRNAVLMPKPVDLRKEVIVRVLSEQPKDAWYKDTADRIIAALDGEK